MNLQKIPALSNYLSRLFIYLNFLARNMLQYKCVDCNIFSRCMRMHKPNILIYYIKTVNN